MKCSILLSGRTNLPQLFCFFFLIGYSCSFSRWILESCYLAPEKKNSIWDFERDILIHEPFASLYCSVLPFGRNRTWSVFSPFSLVFIGLTLRSKWNLSVYCQMRIKIDSFLNRQFSQIPIFASLTPPPIIYDAPLSFIKSINICWGLFLVPLVCLLFADATLLWSLSGLSQY